MINFKELFITYPKEIPVDEGFFVNYIKYDYTKHKITIEENKTIEETFIPLDASIQKKRYSILQMKSKPKNKDIEELIINDLIQNANEQHMLEGIDLNEFISEINLLIYDKTRRFIANTIIANPKNKEEVESLTKAFDNVLYSEYVPENRYLITFCGLDKLSSCAIYLETEGHYLLDIIDKDLIYLAVDDYKEKRKHEHDTQEIKDNLNIYLANTEKAFINYMISSLSTCKKDIIKVSNKIEYTREFYLGLVTKKLFENIEYNEDDLQYTYMYISPEFARENLTLKEYICYLDPATPNEYLLKINNKHVYVKEVDRLKENQMIVVKDINHLNEITYQYIEITA